VRTVALGDKVVYMRDRTINLALVVERTRQLGRFDIKRQVLAAPKSQQSSVRRDSVCFMMRALGVRSKASRTAM
jgi:hypothetical protein